MSERVVQTGSKVGKEVCLSQDIKMVMSEGGLAIHGYLPSCPVYLQIILYQPTVPQDHNVLEVEDIEDLTFQLVLYLPVQDYLIPYQSS